MHTQDGQASAEYLAVILLVAGVIGAAAALSAVTGVGDQVIAAFRRALCVVAGQACDEARAPCVRASGEHADGGHLNVLIARVGRREVVMREQRADGTVALTLIDEGSTGADVGTGIEAHVRWGSHSWAAGSELRAAILAGHAAGRTWVVSDGAAADRLLLRIRMADRSHRAKATIAPTAGYSPYPPMPVEVHAPEPDVTFSERTGDLALDFRSAARTGEIHLTGRQAYGERIDRTTGRRTVYVRDDVTARGWVSLARFGLRGEGAGEERYGITYDRAGRPVDLEVLSTLDVTGTAGLPPALARIAGWLRIGLRGEKHVETEQHLDLTDPANVGAAAAFLGMLGHDTSAAQMAAGMLRGRLERSGTLSVRTYGASESAHEVGGHATLGGIGVGGELGSEDRSAHLLAAVMRAPDGAWRADPACGVI